MFRWTLRLPNRTIIDTLKMLTWLQCLEELIEQRKKSFSLYPRFDLFCSVPLNTRSQFRSWSIGYIDCGHSPKLIIVENFFYYWNSCSENLEVCQENERRKLIFADIRITSLLDRVQRAFNQYWWDWTDQLNRPTWRA